MRISDLTWRKAMQRLAGAGSAAAAEPPRNFIPKLEGNLRNIVAFWYPATLDRTNGGYVINHDAAGKPNPAGSKGIVTQARQLWLFSRLARSGYDSHHMAEAADHGFAFLRDKMGTPSMVASYGRLMYRGRMSSARGRASMASPSGSMLCQNMPACRTARRH